MQLCCERNNGFYPHKSGREKLREGGSYVNGNGIHQQYENSYSGGT